MAKKRISNGSSKRHSRVKKQILRFTKEGKTLIVSKTKKHQGKAHLVLHLLSILPKPRYAQD